MPRRHPNTALRLWTSGPIDLVPPLRQSDGDYPRLEGVETKIRLEELLLVEVAHEDQALEVFFGPNPGVGESCGELVHGRT